MKQSQAFAAFRQSLITDKSHAILNELAPAFNARCEDIRRKAREDMETYHNEALVNNRVKSAIYDLVLYRKQIIDGVQNALQQAVTARLADDQAELIEEVHPDDRREGLTKLVHIAKFPDGSSARVPQALWIDYSVFDRV